jgi:hypothetical protein
VCLRGAFGTSRAEFQNTNFPSNTRSFLSPGGDRDIEFHHEDRLQVPTLLRENQSFYVVALTGRREQGRNSWRSCTACFYAPYNCDKGLPNESLEIHSLAKISVGYGTGKYYFTRGLRLYTDLLNIGATTEKQR